MSALVDASAIVVYEATFGLARKKAAGARPTEALVEEARSAVVKFLMSIGAVEVAITNEVGTLAVAAGARFGKAVGHPAKLNMGDCFAYACAKSQGLPIFFKGADFIHTDIDPA